ncbi:MAG: hypothetical protein KAR11_04965 [Phycisphaerae bacterium]|nr:hypothetical protein [Phycisphaerae bacterium]
MDKGSYKPSREEVKAAVFGDCPAVVEDALRMAASVIEITSNYDVRNMTPSELIEVSTKLYDIGAIEFGEYSILSFQPELYDGFDENSDFYLQLQSDPDRPRDFIAEWQRGLWELQSANPGVFNPTMAATREIIELLKCFTTTETEV